MGDFKMKNKVIISIIIPVYNKVKYLERTLNSVLEQSFTNFELILVDDGSNDGSEKVCDRYALKDERVKVIHIPNGGVSNARNIGLDIAQGEYVQFVDSDDYLHPNMLVNLYNIMKEYHPDIIVSGITKVNHAFEELVTNVPSLNGLINKLEMLESFAEEQKKTGLYGCVSNKFIKRQKIEEINLRFNPDIKLAEDLDFYLDLYNHIKNIYFENKSYYYYIQNTDNSSTSPNIKNDYFTQILINVKQKELLKSNKVLNKKNKEIINMTITNFSLCYIYENFDKNFSNFKSTCLKLNDSKIINSLSTANQNKFNQLIIKNILKEKIFNIYFLIYGKYLIRYLYRKVKKLVSSR